MIDYKHGYSIRLFDYLYGSLNELADGIPRYI